MLADDMVPDEAARRNYLGTLNSEATRLTHLVENVLSYAKLERGSARRRMETLTLGELMRRLAPRLEQRTSAANMQLDWAAAGGNADERKVRVDAAALEQILFNLVDNACKYAGPRTENPVIRITVSVADGRLRIKVRDHGPGIPDSEVRKIFLPFHKSADQAADSAPGVGLGLALCRRLCAELHGRLRHEKPTDGGACFVVELPA
jgi:K+-sensing histidine kinase KdpD